MDQDREQSPIQRLIHQEKQNSEKHKKIVETLKGIPHLNLGLDVDIRGLLSEAELVENFYPHKLHPAKGLPSRYMKHHEWSFQGQCLIDFKNDPIGGMSDVVGHLYEEPEARFDSDGRLIFEPTTLGLQMPGTLEVLRSISPFVNRTRLIRTPPGGGIPWHSHHNNVYQNEYYRLGIVHIPLISSSEALHSVRSFENSQAMVHRQFYEPGQAYLFNSWHDHEFWNHSSQDRWTLIAYFNLTDEHFLDFLRPLANEYKGPRID